MQIFRTKSPRAWILGFALAFVQSSAFAFSIFTVGPGCPYTDIQTAVNDAAATPGVDYVWISNDLVTGTRHNYTGQHIRVNDADGVIIEGGFISCFDPDITASETTTISGAGNDGGPVFEITSAGGDVFLGNLLITGADRDGNAEGGGINFTGQVGGALLLSNTTVTQNRAGYGGGINVNGAGSPAAVVLESNTLIDFNTATTSGGGIRVEGNTRLYALDPQTLIGYNHADGGYGGGVEVIGPARADIGSPGYGGLPVVYDNTAEYGGGVAGVEDSFGNGSQVRIFTTDASNPVQISDNSASARGGAIYVGGLQSHNYMCVYDFRIDDNTAPDGAAIYINYLGEVGFNRSPNGDEQNNTCRLPETPPELGAVACAKGAPCNELIGNIAEDTSGNPTTGSTIQMENYTSLYANRLIMQDNQGAHVIALAAADFDPTDFVATNCLLTDNTLTEELIATGSDGFSYLNFDSCTFANNVIGAPFVILSRDSFTMTNSIVDQPGRATVDYSGPPQSFLPKYVLSNDTSTLNGHTGVLQGQPIFVDAANRNYRLSYGSMGIDYAPATTNVADLDRNPRTVDLAPVGNLYGPMDIGAYELQQVPACVASDTIFCNGFESEN